MKHIKHIFLCLCVFVFEGVLFVSVYGQQTDPDWERLSRGVVDLYNAGEYDRALELAQKALRVAEKNFGPEHPDVATSLNNLAGLYQAQGRYAEAEPLYKRALAIREKALGLEHPDVIQSLENLAALYAATERSAEAEALRQRATKLRKKE